MQHQTDSPTVADLLCGFDPGYLPKDVFDAVARLVVTPSFVVVPLFWRNGAVRVLLTRRAPDDKDYPGMLHPPGKIMLASDPSLDAVFDRLRPWNCPR